MPVEPAGDAALQLLSGACSHIGLRRRRNEDAFLAAPEHGLFAVADGMGGHPAGDVASRMALETVARALTGPADQPPNRARLTEAFAAANAALLEHALARPEHSGLGTTLTLLCTRGGQAVIGHIGDSRLYLLRDGECRQLTIDHTWVEREVTEGRLTRAAVRHHPNSAVLLRVLGGADAKIDLIEAELRRDDRILLCTDGVSNAIPRADLAAIVAQRNPPGDTARHLCESADSHGGFDNSTAIVVDVH